MQKKQGISLIVLIITIIVMIILATAVIISLNNNGIISKAHEAVEKTNESEVKELVNFAWANAYAENVGKSETELQAKLQEAVEKALSDNNLNKEDYGIEVTTTGVNITKGWLQTKNRTVVKGDIVLQIGSTIDYTDKAGENGAEKYTGGWKVLGAENGEFLIVSAENVTTIDFNGNWDFEEGKKVYESALNDLKEICEPYGTGAYATGARSITVEDVDRVTGYDKTTYGKGTIYEYGNIVTYSYNGPNNPAYSGTNGVTGTLSSTHSSGFHWYDLNNAYHNVSASDLTANNSGIITADGVEAKVKSTYYYYDVDQKTDLAKGTDAYSMLFGNDNVSYWLAAPYVFANSSYSSFGLRYASSGRVGGIIFVDSYGGGGGGSNGVRAVVHLSQDYNP